VRRDRAAVGKQLTGVLEQDHSVTEEAPALPRKRRYGVSGVAIRGVGWRTRGLVQTHCGDLRFLPPGWLALPVIVATKLGIAKVLHPELRKV